MGTKRRNAAPAGRIVNSPVAGTASRARRRSVDDREHVAGGEDEVLLAVVLDLGAAVLGVDDDIADAHVHRDAVAVVIDPTRANRDDLALLGLLLRGVRDDDARRGRRLSLT